MKNIKAIVLLVPVLAILLTSCLKDDEAVKPHQPGVTTTNSFNMGTNYRYQTYFDIETNTFVSQNLKTTWDMAFDTRPSGFSIIVNAAKFCKVANTGTTNFNAVTDTVGAQWKADETGSLDTTAIGIWGTYSADTAISLGNCYILDRGFDENNVHLGYKKIIINGAGKYTFSITFANLDGSDLHTVEVLKNNTYNFTFLSLNNGGETVIVEPPSNTWDITFTQYTYIYQTVDYPYYPYLVTGVLLNQNHVTAAADSVNSFESIQLADTATLNFTNKMDIIGYDWKDYSFTTAQYTIRPSKNYVIKSRNGLYYKLHFLDFYKDGIKGNILFEYQLL